MALAIYRKLLSNTLQQAEALDAQTYIHWAFDAPDLSAFAHFKNHLQQGEDLGSRMHHSIHQVLQMHQKAVLVGSDIPRLSQTILREAFQSLNRHDLVLGPSADGGYYLIGMKKPHPEIFALDQWSNPQVFEQTCQIARNKGLTIALLPMLHDLDTAADLVHFPELLKMAENGRSDG